MKNYSYSNNFSHILNPRWKEDLKKEKEGKDKYEGYSCLKCGRIPIRRILYDDYPAPFCEKHTPTDIKENRGRFSGRSHRPYGQYEYY